MKMYEIVRRLARPFMPTLYVHAHRDLRRLVRVACVEVIEHVERDEAFVAHLARVLKPGGWVYLTTPNGDYIRNEPPNRNPDHVKHFSRQQLHDLLASHFDEVTVKYGVKTGKYRVKGLRSMSPRRPLQTLVTMACNVINRLESIGVEQMPKRTAHLVAVARKAA